MLEAGEERAPPGRPPKQHERVVRHAHERRSEHREQSLVVVAILEQAEVREQVDGLLLAEVAAPCRSVGRQSLFAQRFFVRLGARPGREEEHDLARSALAAVDQLANARRHVPRLAEPPLHAAPPGSSACR